MTHTDRLRAAAEEIEAGRDSRVVVECGGHSHVEYHRCPLTKNEITTVLARHFPPPTPGDGRKEGE